MIVLDCESRNSALASIAAIYRVEGIELVEYLRALDLSAHCSKTRPPHSDERELRLLVEASFRRRSQPIDRICWFHLSRAHPKSDFSTGIQPLSTALDRVWDTIIEVFRGTKHEGALIQLRRAGVPNYHYMLKADEPFHAGPYAVLVREVAMYPAMNSIHDYLWLPEIMEDICNGYEEVHGEKLHKTLNQALCPMIVKFWSVEQQGIGVETALHYLYVTARDPAGTWIPHTCYDGENRPISPDRILGVERVGQRTGLSQ